MRFYRPAWAEVNLGNLAYNFRRIKKLLAPDVKTMVCVKADAYGHGMIPVSKRLASCGVDYLGVASIDEGIKLREAGINLPILILGAILKEDARPLFIYGLMPTVFTEELACYLNKKAAGRRKKIKIHIKVDTGMGRIGVLYDDALSFIKKIYKLKFIEIEGVFTHLSCADTNANFTRYQIGIFSRLIENLRREAIDIALFHCANSIGLINFKESHFNLVRPGLIIYGLYPKEGLEIKLKAVLSLKTKVVHAKQVPRGYGISYGRTYITGGKTNVVTLPIGYGDGYPRNLSNRADVLIKGRRFKISGMICMDQMMVDVGNLKIKPGEEAVLIGPQGKENISAEELAVLSRTIPYEILCSLGSRLPRVYI